MSILTKFISLLIELSTYSDEEKLRENEEFFKALYPDEKDDWRIKRCLETFLEMACYSQILIESEDAIVSIPKSKSLLKSFFRKYNCIKLDGNADLSEIYFSLQDVLKNLINISLKLPKDKSKSKRILRSIINAKF